MACEFEVYLNAGQHPAAAAGALAALDLVDALEAQLTVYRETSEVMDINRRAAVEPVAVEPRLFQLLQLCLRLNAETGGAFDITSGPLTKVWGFYRRQGAVPTAEAIEQARQNVGGEKIELDETRRTVRFTRPGVEINLGSIGKGYALDRCAERLAEQDVESFLLHGGQSSVLGRGSRRETLEAGHETSNKGAAGWKVGVIHPLRPDDRLAEILLRNRALGTSGAGSQFFRHAGKRYGHILDPRTGWPAEGVYSSTVVASTAAEADALATAFFVLGPVKAIEYCQTHPRVAFLMVDARGRSREVTTAGLDDSVLRILSR